MSVRLNYIPRKLLEYSFFNSTTSFFSWQIIKTCSYLQADVLLCFTATSCYAWGTEQRVAHGDRMEKIRKVRINRWWGWGAWWKVKLGRKKKRKLYQGGEHDVHQIQFRGHELCRKLLLCNMGEFFEGKSHCGIPRPSDRSEAVRTPSSWKLHPLIPHYTNSQTPNYTTA